MKQREIILIAAIGINGEIGHNNELLWHLPGDLPRFKKLTLGSPLIMGRKTFDSIGQALPGRLNIVLTKNEQWTAEGVTITGSVDSALAIADNLTRNIFIVGGSQIYNLFLPLATGMELTKVFDAPVADTFFPNFSDADFKEVSRVKNEHNNLKYDYVSYQRI